MASVADLCNMALSHIGARAQIASIDPPDGTVEAGLCARFYPIARVELLESAAWSFNKTRAILAEVTNPSSVWAYAYALPSDALNSMRVLPTTTQYMLPNERGSAEFAVQSGVLLANEPEAVLVYSRDITDTAQFGPEFVTALSYLLASYLAGPIVKGIDGMNLGVKLRQIATSIKGSAAASDANNGTETTEFTPSSIAARA